MEGGGVGGGGGGYDHIYGVREQDRKGDRYGYGDGGNRSGNVGGGGRVYRNNRPVKLAESSGPITGGI